MRTNRVLRRWRTHLGLRLRTQVPWLTVLPAVVLVLTAVLCPSYGTTYPTRGDQLQAVAWSRSNTTMVFMYGQLAAGADSVQLAAWELGAMTCLVLGVVVVLRTAGLARGEEDQGRAEILHAASAGPVARVTGQAVLLALVSALLGTGAGGGLIALDGTRATDACAYGAAVGVTCMLLAAITLLGAQLVSDAVGARSLGLSVVAATYIAYGLECAKDWPWVRWAGAASPFRLREDLLQGSVTHWESCAWALVVWLLLTCAAAILARRRDLGQGLVPVRPPWTLVPVRARGPVGLALWLSAGGLVAWALAVSSTTSVLIDMGRTLVERVRQGGIATDNGLGSILAGADPAESYLMYIGSLAGALAACQAVALASRAGGDEVAGRIEILASTGVSPARVLCGWWAAAVAGSGLTLTCCAGGAAAVGRQALGTSTWDALRLVGGQWPVAIAAASVASVLCALRPRWRVLAWVPVLLSLAVTQFGTSLDLPERLRDANPLAQAGQVGSWWLLALSAAATCACAVLTGRRDLALVGPGRRWWHRLPVHIPSTSSRG